MTPSELLEILLSEAGITDSQDESFPRGLYYVRKFGNVVCRTLLDGTAGPPIKAFRVAYDLRATTASIELYSEVYVCLDSTSYPQMKQLGYLGSYELADEGRMRQFFIDIKTCLGQQDEY